MKIQRLLFISVTLTFVSIFLQKSSIFFAVAEETNILPKNVEEIQFDEIKETFVNLAGSKGGMGGSPTSKPSKAPTSEAPTSKASKAPKSKAPTSKAPTKTKRG